MALKITTKGSTTKIQFVLPDDAATGPVSAVGTFNDWTPGKHKLVKRSNGTRSVTVAVRPARRSPSATWPTAASGSTTRTRT
jgi:hypothetical protein